MFKAEEMYFDTSDENLENAINEKAAQKLGEKINNGIVDEANEKAISREKNNETDIKNMSREELAALAEKLNAEAEETRALIAKMKKKIGESKENDKTEEIDVKIEKNEPEEELIVENEPEEEPIAEEEPEEEPEEELTDLEEASDAEVEKRPLLAEVINKAKNNKALKNVLVVALAISISLGAGLVARHAINSSNFNDVIGTSITQEISENHESISERSTYHGMFASEDGSTYNAEKGGKYNFGEALKNNASEEEMKEDLESRMIQPAQLAATYDYMRQKTSDPNFGVEGADFKNPNDLVEAMKADPELHQKVYDYVTNIIRDNAMSEKTVSGKYNNFYMDSAFETGDADTSKVEVIGCTTTEKDTKVYVVSYEWQDEEGMHKDTFTLKEKCGGQPIDVINFTDDVRQIEDVEEKPGPGPIETIHPTSDGGIKINGGGGGRHSGGGGPTIIPKNAENLTRIDNEILEDIAKDVNTEKVTVTPTPDVTKVETKTEKPTSKDYQEKPADYEKPEATFKPNSSSENATSFTTEKSSNDYSQDRGGANTTDTNAVKADTEAQAAANANERTEENTIHTSDLGGMSIDDLLNS